MDLPQEEIEADGYRLRPSDERDIDDVTLACQDQQSQRFLPNLPSPYTRDAAEHWLRVMVPQTWASGGAQFTVVEGDRLVASVGFPRHDAGNGVLEVGYWVAPWARGRGVATAATRAVTAWGFDHGANRVELMNERANTASQRVAIAAGFGFESARKGAGRNRDGSYEDLLVWARLAADGDAPWARPFPDAPRGGISDGVVRIRPSRVEDATTLAETAADPETKRWATRPLPDTPEVQAANLAGAESDWLTGQRVRFTTCDAVSGEVAGEVTFYWVDQEAGVINLGYSVHPAWRGQGIATRAARLAADWALGLPSIERVEAGANVENRASRAVLAKAGFAEEGTLRSLVRSVGGPRQDIALTSRVAPA